MTKKKQIKIKQEDQKTLLQKIDMRDKERVKQLKELRQQSKTELFLIEILSLGGYLGLNLAVLTSNATVSFKIFMLSLLWFGLAYLLSAVYNDKRKEIEVKL